MSSITTDANTMFRDRDHITADERTFFGLELARCKKEWANAGTEGEQTEKGEEVNEGSIASYWTQEYDP
jgi:hypothetical protein